LKIAVPPSPALKKNEQKEKKILPFISLDTQGKSGSELNPRHSIDDHLTALLMGVHLGLHKGPDSLIQVAHKLGSHFGDRRFELQDVQSLFQGHGHLVKFSIGPRG